MTDVTSRHGIGFIAPVDAQAAAKDSVDIDKGSAQLMQAEAEYIAALRKSRGDVTTQDDTGNLVGLALSGGGIRSATFSMGVMQALARRGLLKRFDYLSTVSGGGYIGSAITWLVSALALNDYKAGKGEADTGADLKFGLDKKDIPFGCDDPDPEAAQDDNDSQRSILKYLRRHGNYLSPGAGISLFSLLGVVLRGTLLNLLVWIPILILFFQLFILVSGQFSGTGSSNPPVLSAMITDLKLDTQSCKPPIPAGIAVTPPASEAVCADLKSLSAINKVEDRLSELWGFELFMWLGALAIGGLLVTMVVSSLLTWFSRDRTKRSRQKWYHLRRATQKKVAILLPLVALTLVIGTLPVVAAYLSSWLAAAGPMAMVTGAAVLLRGFLKSCTQGAGTPTGLLVSLAAALFLYGVFLVSYHVAFLVFPFGLNPVFALAALIVVPLVTGWFVNLNYISIHRFYRDRLMETFMPDISQALKNRTGAANGADGAMLHELGKVGDPRGPYHIVNTNLVLVNSKNDIYKDRGGDNFMLSPLYCGSNATGWCSTKHFMGGNMTLATAIAISGAAANPNTGVGGEGLTRNLFLSLVMSLLNLKLGYWAYNPDPDKRPIHSPNHFRPGAYSFGNALGWSKFGFNENRNYLQLSDGGHFENSGIYELVRRRVKLIVACDGGADADFSFSDFQTTIRRIEDDFGARVKTVKGASPDNIVPIEQEDSVYPKDGKFAEQGHMIANITYSDGSKGILIYLKTTLIKSVSFKVKGYAARNPEFPDQSTADQFFDEVQFEAYRELGYRIADVMLDSTVPGDVGARDATTLENLIRSGQGTSG